MKNTALKFRIVFLLVPLFSLQMKGQTERWNTKSCYGFRAADKASAWNTSRVKRNGPGVFDRMLFSAGLSAGQETFLGLPKLGMYKDFSLSPENRAVPKYGFRTYSAYVGAEVSMFVFFAGFFSASLNTGFAIGPVTVDNSFAVSAAAGPDGEGYSYSTCNPKIGLNIGPVWLKAGPSYVIHGDSSMGNWFKVNGTYCNAELLYLHTFQKKRQYSH